MTDIGLAFLDNLSVHPTSFSICIQFAQIQTRRQQGPKGTGTGRKLPHAAGYRQNISIASRDEREWPPTAKPSARTNL
jgi:hypothetical protein